MEAQPAPGIRVPADRRHERSRLVSLGSVSMLALLAGAGAAAHPEGVLIGVPSAGVVVLAVLAGALIRVSGLEAAGGFLLPILGVVLGSLFWPSFAPLLLFSGRPLFAFVLAALFLAVVAWRARPPRGLLLPLVFAIYAGVSYEVQTRVGPDGDEPQYLMVAESLIRDHDLVLDNDFQPARYAPFFSRPLKPDFRIRGPEGQIYSLHAVGLSLLILPAYALGGYAGASFFMAFLAALLVRELRRLVEEVTAQKPLAEGTAWLVALSPPIIHFAGLIFTEIPAALLLCVGLRTAVFGRSSRALLAAAGCAAALPWLNVRYTILALAMGVAIGLRWWDDFRTASGEKGAIRPLLAPALILIASALALSLYHLELWGFLDPRRVYGRRREFSLDVLPEGLPGLFLDQEFGLFVYAPVLVLSFAGFVHLARKNRTLALAGLVAALGVIATASVWPMWRGGFNPPARFLVPLISILTAGLALSLQRGIRPATALLAGWSLWCGLGGALNIDTIHRDRDGVAPFFRTQSGAREWTAALPSFVLSEDRPTRILAWPWTILLGLALLSALRRSPGGTPGSWNRDLLLALSAFVATAVVTDRLSPRLRAPERDAMRLLGAPSLLLPSVQFQSSTEAAWTIDLFYEPHRFPDGLAFAHAVRLERDGYSILLLLADAPTASAVPSLVLRDRRSGRTRVSPVTLQAESLHSRFEIDEAGDYDLLLRGGEPVALRQIRLRVVR
jgi:hypothetical protein